MKNTAFKQLGQLAVQHAVAIAVGASLIFGGVNVYDSHVESTVQKNQQIVVSQSQDLSTSLSNLQNKNKTFYENNLKMLEKLQADSEILKQTGILDIEQAIKENQQAYDKATQETEKYIGLVQRLEQFKDLPAKDDTAKFYFYKDEATMEAFNSASSSSLALHQEIAKQHMNLVRATQLLTNVKQEVVEIIKEKLTSKDFDLSKARENFKSKVAEGIHDQKAEVSEMRKAIQDNGGKSIEDIDLESLDKADKAIDSLEKVAEEEILKDETMVSGMIKDLQGGQLANLESSIQNSPQQQASTHHSGPSFLQYYLLSQWLNNSNVSNMHSSTNNTSMHQQFNNYQPYDIRNSNSHLSSKVEQQMPHLSSEAHQNYKKYTLTKSRLISYKASTRVSSVHSSVHASSHGHGGGGG